MMFKRFKEWAIEPQKEKQQLLGTVAEIKHKGLLTMAVLTALIIYVFFFREEKVKAADYGFLLIHLAIMIPCAWFAFGIVRNVRKGILIHADNVKNIDIIAGILSLGGSALLILFWGKAYSDIMALYVNFVIIDVYWFVAAIIKLLAIMLEKAVKLQEEQDLTI